MTQQEETSYRFNASDYLRKIDPDKNFYEKNIYPLEEGGEEIAYIKITVNKVWVTQAWNQYQMHVELDGEYGFEKLTEDITKDQYHKFIEYKGEKRRLNLFSQVYGKIIVIKKVVSSKHIDIRVTPELYDKLSKDAKQCKQSLSDYCRDHLKGKAPRAALSDEEQKMMMELISLRLDIKNFRSAMTAQLKGMSQEERLHYLVEGESLSRYRQYLNNSIRVLDRFIDKNT